MGNMPKTRSTTKKSRKTATRASWPTHTFELPKALMMLLFTVLVAGIGVTVLNLSHAQTKPPAKPAFAYYYMWWDHQHWVSHLGPNYPLTQTPLPLPATLNKQSCGTVNNYTGNVLTDVSQGLAYDQLNPAVFDADVQLAQASGLKGFLVNWVGDGTTTQTKTTGNYNKRLQYMFDAVHKLNAQGKAFSLIFNYQSSAAIRSQTQFTNDFNYLLTNYGTDTALDHTYSTKPEMIMAGTWKYADTDLANIASQFRPRMYLIGDEKPSSWTTARGASLDGTTYYWSSQDPYKNPTSFTQLQNFSTAVKSTTNPDGSQKVWLAPFTPGYNAMLVYGTTTCVPRKGKATMTKLYKGNLASNPDGWAFISWNEIAEGTYVTPLTRYNTTYTTDLKKVIK
ncbi:MAG: hypothetical protein JWS12_490 [Candidatus Saccharibacteria bacterium]|nr:hypothetical protein [Candidatus Saccharibacteria bacterium]